AYSCWPERTGAAWTRPGADTARAGGGGGGGSAACRGGGAGRAAVSVAPATGSYWARNLASNGSPSSTARASLSLLPQASATGSTPAPRSASISDRAVVAYWVAGRPPKYRITDDRPHRHD